MIIHLVRLERDLLSGERAGELHRVTREQAADWARRGIAVDLGADEHMPVIGHASGRDPYPIGRLGRVRGRGPAREPDGGWLTRLFGWLR